MQTELYNETDSKKRFNKAVWSRIFQLLLPHRNRYIAVVLMMLVLALLDAAFPLVIRFAIDKGIAVKNTQHIYVASSVYIVLVFIQSALICGFITVSGKIGSRMLKDLKQMVFNHVQVLPLSFFDKTPVGWILSRIMSDTQRIGETIAWGSVDFIWGIFSMAAMMGAMLWIDWRLASGVLVIIPIIVYVSNKFQKLIIAAYRQVRHLNSEITTAYNEGIMGVRVIKSLSREQAVGQGFSSIATKMSDASCHTAILSASYLPIVHVLGVIGSMIVLYSGGNQVLAGGISIGTLVAFITFARRFFDPANEVARVFGQLQETQVSADRVFALLDVTPEILVTSAGSYEQDTQGAVTFQNVSFAYIPNEPVLSDISFDIPAGRTVALVGPTGGGKTTVINLIARFYEPTAGAILIDGNDIRERSIPWIRSQLGIVLQTPHLFTGAIKDNIRYGKLDATDEEIMNAAQVVGVHAFIQSLPKQYDTMLSEGGHPLSTGQKQLISLARALLANPAILIMDEATSSIDTETELHIQRATELLLKNRTSFIIAHRLSTIRNADLILVIEKGRIVESGTHFQLLRRQGHYFRLYSQQFLELTPGKVA